MSTSNITHSKFSRVTEGSDPSLILTSDWNDEHVIVLPVVMGTLTLDEGEIIDSGGVISFTGCDLSMDEVQILHDLNHDGDYIGFFGKAPAAQTIVTVLGTVTVATNDTTAINEALASIQTKLDAAITALRSYGLFEAPV